MGDAEDGDCEEIEKKGGGTRGSDGIGHMKKRSWIFPAPFVFSKSNENQFTNFNYQTGFGTYSQIVEEQGITRIFCISH